MASVEDRTLSLLLDAIVTELRVTNAMASLGLAEQSVQELAHGVLSGVAQAFDVRWRPKWVREGEPHIWSDGGETFGRCTECLAVSPSGRTSDDVLRWFAEHQVAHA